jgi:hypothetical protein
MCRDVCVYGGNAGPDRLETVGDIRRVVGSENIVWYCPSLGPDPDDNCMCNVDVAASFALVGGVVTGFDPIEIAVRVPNRKLPRTPR